MHDRLDRIAADGSQKLPIRILPVLRAERAAGRMPAGATRVLAAWVCHLRGLGAPVSDVRAGEVVPLAAGPAARRGAASPRRRWTRRSAPTPMWWRSSSIRASSSHRQAVS